MPSARYYALVPMMVFARFLQARAARRGSAGVQGAVAAMSRLSAPLARLPKGVEAIRGQVGAVGGIWIVPAGAPERPVVLYLHGGEFVTALSTPLLISGAYLALFAGRRLFYPDYRQLPDTYPAAHDDCFAVFRELIVDGRAPQLVGDSTGGVLALATLLRARSAGLPQPSVCVLFSPTVDYRFEEPGFWRARDLFVDARFVEIGHRAYVSGHDLDVPDLSPVDQDLGGIAPLRVLVGARDLTRTGVERLERAALRDGVDIRVSVWPHMSHGWYVMADQLPEGRRAVEEAAAILRAGE